LPPSQAVRGGQLRFSTKTQARRERRQAGTRPLCAHEHGGAFAFEVDMRLATDVDDDSVAGSAAESQGICVANKARAVSVTASLAGESLRRGEMCISRGCRVVQDEPGGA
jgi:hypothetical protein